MLRKSIKIFFLISALAVFVVGIFLFIAFNVSYDSGHEKNIYETAVENGYSADMKSWIKNILGQQLLVKENRWWLDGYDTGIRAKDIDNTKRKSVVVKCFKRDGHIWIELSDGSQIDGGETNEKVEALELKYSIRFLDYDGSLLKSETVNWGESAHAPKIPSRKGFRFYKWDKTFDNITEDMRISAQYISDESTVLSLKNVTARPGDKGIKIPVRIKKNPGILGMHFAICYDESIMKLVKATSGRAFEGVLNFTKGKILKSGCKFLWDGEEIHQLEVKDGEILVMYFDILPSASKGTNLIKIILKKGDVINNSLLQVPVYIEGGEVIIQ